MNNLSEYQDISTAPEDGTWVVVVCVEGETMYEPSIACFCDGEWMEYRHFIRGEVDYDEWPVTHWKPLL